jgi:hypothetical protein
MVRLGAPDRAAGVRKQARKKVWVRTGMRGYPPTFISGGWQRRGVRQARTMMAENFGRKMNLELKRAG